MRQSRAVWVVAVLVALATAAGGVSVGSASDAPRPSRLPALPTKPMSAVDRARVTAIVNELLAREQYQIEVPGLLIGIWSPTQGVYRAGFGQADLKSPTRRPKPSDSFRIGSVSKTFTATVILQLVDEGRLSCRSREP